MKVIIIIINFLSAQQNTRSIKNVIFNLITIGKQKRVLWLESIRIKSFTTPINSQKITVHFEWIYGNCCILH